MKKLRIGVLMGGRSIEREVSLNSGRTICDHLDTARYEVVPIFQAYNGALYILPQRFVHRGKIADFEQRLASEARLISWDDLKQYVDLIYIAQHGRYAEDGTLQGALEMLKIPYIGSKVFASAIGMDKDMQKSFLSINGISTPHSILIKPQELIYYQENNNNLLSILSQHNLQAPLVIKPVHEGSSLGVSIIYNMADLIPALKYAATIFPEKKQAVLIEQYIEGLEFSCIILTDYLSGELLALPPTEIVPTNNSFFDYEQKYMPGKACKHTPARCNSNEISHIQEICKQVMHLLEFTTIGRIDGFLTQDKQIVITDPNSFCGMDPASFAFVQAAQINMTHAHLINHIIETELYNYNMLDKVTYSEEQKKNIPTKKRIAVIFGGKSHEKEVSLESGRNIVYKLSPYKYNVVPLFLTRNLELYKLDQKLLVLHSTTKIEELLQKDMKIAWSDLPDLADFVFIGLHGGEGENGTLQGMLETLHMPYNGSGVLTSALCMNKFKTNQFLRYKNFDVPRGILLEKNNWKQALSNIPAFPVIIKPHDDGCSVLVHKAYTEQELIAAVTNIFTAGKDYALIEECILGMELTVGVIGNNTLQVLPPSQVVACKGILSIEEKFLPGAGENQTPALLAHETLEFIKKTIEHAYRVLSCKGYARIDCFYQTAQQSPTGQERIIILEVNTLPALTPATVLFHQAAELGIKPMDFLDEIITLGYEEHAHYIRTPETHIEINIKMGT